MINAKYQFESFLRYPNIAHGISSQAFGSMKRIDDLTIDRDALAKFAQTIGIVNNIVCMGMFHSGVVSVIENLDTLRVPNTDALITTKKHLPLAVSTADCLPILFYDPKKNAIGVAHAGYKGLLNHIIKNMVANFVSHYKSDPADILVGIGPSIEMKCYEVGKEIIEKFEKVFPEFGSIIIEKNGKYFLDLRVLAKQCLIKQGILEGNIEIMDICTKCNPNFYSYRRGDGDNRFVSLISLQ